MSTIEGQVTRPPGPTPAIPLPLGDLTRPPSQPAGNVDLGANPPGAAAGDASDDKEARGLIRKTLAQWGLESLADWAYDLVVVQDLSIDYVLSVELPQRAEYKKRFAANAEREKKGLAVLAPGEYIAYEAEIRNQFRLAGLPKGFYDAPEDYKRFIAEDVSPAELNARLLEGYRDVQQSDPDVRAGFSQLYGVQGDAMLLAYFLDPNKALPVLERQEAAARVYGMGAKTAFGGVSRGEAERIASLGLTEGAVAEGFAGLVEDRSLFTPLDVGESAIGRGTQIEAAFEGSMAARRRIEQRRRRRQAAFQGGGGFAASREGLGGLGSAAG